MRVCWAALALLFAATTIPAKAADEVLAMERKELAESCTEIEFQDGFVTVVNINQDGRPDALTNYGALSCDGSQSMFCGSGGCTLNIYVQQSDGSYRRVESFLAYEIRFDRPDGASFVVASHGSDCNRIGTMGCERRFRLVGERVVSVEEEKPTASQAAPAKQWSFVSSSTSVVVGAGQEELRLACEAGAVRIKYTAPWMFDGGAINDHIREWDASPGVVASFDVGSRETDIPMRLIEAERMLVARDLIPLDEPLLDQIARGRWLTIHHGGSLEHQLDYALDGSGAAIRSLRAMCG